MCLPSYGTQNYGISTEIIMKLGLRGVNSTTPLFLTSFPCGKEVGSRNYYLFTMCYNFLYYYIVIKL